MTLIFGKFRVYLLAGTVASLLSAAPAPAGLDAPHNAGSSIGCLSCHDVTSTLPKLMPPWTYHDPPADIDDTSMNSMCWSCHDDVDAPHVLTHSSLNTSGNYGDWTVECRVCHGLHSQEQLSRYGAAGYLFTGTSTGLTATTLSKTGAGWEADEFKGMLLVPNTANVNYNYTITANTADTLTVRGPIDLGKAAPGNTFAIVLGKLIRSSVNLGQITDPLNPAAKTGAKTVRFFRREGANSFADGGTTFDGICEVCHTETRHFRNDGGGDDPLHTNVGGAAGSDCLDCHSHENGFVHGGGTGTGCIDCHGHDAGTFFDSDMTAPYTPGSTVSPGRGTVQSHSTHTEASGDDLKGPGIYCDTCHDITRFPSFKSGTDVNGDGRYSLAETDACDTCHSGGGSYDGLDDPVIGAKEIWKNGAYASTSDSTLQAGKETWCATCHDEEASQISGVTAPNVIGDEDGGYTYGTGWGYYKTGHGLATGDYPASEAPAANRDCSGCHDYALAHIDGDPRSYNAAADNYQAGYRLKSIDGQSPMDIPRIDGCESGVMASDFRLCFSCHDSDPFTTSSNYETNFRHTGTPDFNAHYSHLSIQDNCGPGAKADSDWNGSIDSRVVCTTCHNVHGSTQLSMVRDGKLVGREPGLKLAYYNSTVLFQCGGSDPHDPTPQDVRLSASTGTIWHQNSAGNLCGTCHGSCGWDTIYTRTPFDTTPPEIRAAYGKEDSSHLTVHFTEAVYTDTGASGDLINPDFALAGLSQSILASTHTAGDDFAYITLDGILGAPNIGTGQLSAATAGSIYDWKDNAMVPAWVSITADSSPPELSDQDPAHMALDVSPSSNITFSLEDSGSGVDWASFSIQLTGDKGYAKTYTDADVLIVSKTGTPFRSQVTVNPDVNFGGEEVITVTATVNDLVGNALSSPAWSFTTEAASIPQTLALYPAGVDNAYGFSDTFPPGTWETALDTSDGLASYTMKCGGAAYPTDTASRFRINMDNSGFTAETVQQLTIRVVAKYAPSCPTGGTASGTVGICYKTGTNTLCTDAAMSGDFSSYSSTTFSTDSDGGSLDPADIDSLQVEVQRKATGSINLIVTEVYVDVEYLP